MQDKQNIILLFLSMFILIAFVGFFQSWNLALTIFNLCIISSIMSLGINIQWGNAGIVNFVHKNSDSRILFVVKNRDVIEKNLFFALRRHRI